MQFLRYTFLKQFVRSVNTQQVYGRAQNSLQAKCK